MQNTFLYEVMLRDARSRTVEAITTIAATSRDAAIAHKTADGWPKSRTRARRARKGSRLLPAVNP